MQKLQLGDQIYKGFTIDRKTRGNDLKGKTNKESGAGTKKRKKLALGRGLDALLPEIESIEYISQEICYRILFRKKLVNEIRRKGLKDEEVLGAIERVPRHYFMDSSFVKFAYKDHINLFDYVNYKLFLEQINPQNVVLIFE